MLPQLWLFIVLIGLVVWTVTDTRQYRRFVQETETHARQAFYWRWTAQSFVLLTGASVVTLLLLDRGDAWSAMPPEFSALMPRSRPEPRNAAEASGMRAGMLVGFSVGALITLLVWRQRLAKMRAPVIGDIEPLLPRNRAERWVAIPLCLNAGFSEELFFRLALPLLLTSVSGSVPLSLAMSVVLFGLIHWYQGWRGIVGTTFVGALLTFAYLASGSLARVMVVHAAIDLIGLIVRPLISEHYARRGAAIPAT
jgi:hypothetical protein